jgi:hypothetical protein
MLVTTEVVKNLEKKQTITYKTTSSLSVLSWKLLVHSGFWNNWNGSFFIQIFFFIIILILNYLRNQNQQILTKSNTQATIIY